MYQPLDVFNAKGYVVMKSTVLSAKYPSDSLQAVGAHDFEALPELLGDESRRLRWDRLCSC